MTEPINTSYLRSLWRNGTDELFHSMRAAADEIDRLRGQLAELQPNSNPALELEPTIWVESTGPGPRNCPCDQFTAVQVAPSAQDAYDAGVRDGIELAAETVRRQTIVADTLRNVSTSKNVPEGTPGTNGGEGSPGDASATADARGAVRDDNPPGGGTPGEWLERQPTSPPCP